MILKRRLEGVDSKGREGNHRQGGEAPAAQGTRARRTRAGFYSARTPARPDTEESLCKCQTSMWKQNPRPGHPYVRDITSQVPRSL